jgi:hypothetical protein
MRMKLQNQKNTRSGVLPIDLASFGSMVSFFCHAQPLLQLLDVDIRFKLEKCFQIPQQPAVEVDITGSFCDITDLNI